MSQMDIKGKGTMELADGVLHMRWKPGAYIGIDVARAGLEAISTLTRGARLPMLVEIQGVTTPQPLAKNFLPRPTSHVWRFWGPLPLIARSPCSVWPCCRPRCR